MNNSEKRNLRKKSTAEEFTPVFLVNSMLDKLPSSIWSENSTFCDPACGNCNFLVEILKRKLKLGHSPIKALQSLFGCDCMSDNIKEGRLRLLKVINNHVKDNKLKMPDKIELIRAVGKNIKCTPISKKYPRGSLDYDFEFKEIPSDEDCRKGLEKIRNEKLLDQVEV